MPSRPPKTPACRDPADVAFLELAMVAKADWLVTGDRDLLPIEGRMRTPVITPEALLGSPEKP
jgi:predicted nucleic acid-binding protein